MPIELRAEDSGTRPSVSAGDLVTVRLPESPTTGYRWEADYDEARLRLADDRFEGAEAPRGAGGERVLVFEAIGPGPSRLRLDKRRTWEDAAAKETFWVELQIQSPT